MTEMMELSDKDLKTTIINMLHWAMVTLLNNLKERIASLSAEIKGGKKAHILYLGLKSATRVSGMTTLTSCLGQGICLFLEHPSLLFKSCLSRGQLRCHLLCEAFLDFHAPSPWKLPTPQHSHSSPIILSSLPPHLPSVKTCQRDCVLSQVPGIAPGLSTQKTVE